MRVLTVVFVMMLATLQYHLWIGDGGFSALWKLNDAVAAQLEENRQLEIRNRTLEAEVKDLKTGDAAIEERARSELGMVGPDETFFQVIAPGSSHQQGLKKTAYRCLDKDKCLIPGFGQ